ncbi:MAG: peptidylprolyl isomerase [Gemmataceae bacterium]|nr:peptidylprolyl isomerase [Gemmataceae bacterium]
MVTIPRFPRLAVRLWRTQTKPFPTESEPPLDKTKCKAEVDAETAKIDFAENNYTVDLTTNNGAIRVEFFTDKAPNHAKNFIALAKIGFFDGAIFHRIIKDFMIQGGCPQGTGYGNGGYNINAEFNATKHVPGVLSMARSGDPNSASTQFFICLKAYPSLDGQYTAFGKVMDSASQDVVNAIGLVKTDRNDKPVEKVVIEKAAVTVTAK